VAGGVGAADQTVQIKLQESVSVKDFGGVGDGSTSDQVAVVNTIASGAKEVTVNDNLKFLVTSFSNNMGVELKGKGAIVKAITGGLQQLNTYADKDKYIFGREYMAAFHNLLIGQMATPGRKPIMVFSGDSTTAGVGVSSDYTINELLKTAGEVSGLQTPYGLSSINRGQSGANTAQWVTSYLAGDLAANPDLLVLRWGINDPGWLQNGTTPPLDAGQSYPGRRTPADFIASLRQGLTTIRASRGVGSLSILLMSPNSTSDTPNARDELYYEAIAAGIKQAARDFLCTFIDTYALLKDSRPAATIWMDDPFGDGRGIHPLNVMNSWIAGVMSDVVFPTGLRQKIGRANVRSTGGAEDVGDASRLPTYYNYGITISRATAGFPLNGMVTTTRGSDEIVTQVNVGYRDADLGLSYVRVGRSAILDGLPIAWGSWVRTGSASAQVAAATGYTNPGAGGMRVATSGSQVCIEGYLTMNTPGIIGAGTTIGTVPVGYRPIVDAFYTSGAVVYNGTVFAGALVRIQSNGDIVVVNATGINGNRVYLNGAWSLTTQ